MSRNHTEEWNRRRAGGHRRCGGKLKFHQGRRKKIKTIFLSYVCSLDITLLGEVAGCGLEGMERVMGGAGWVGVMGTAAGEGGGGEGSDD